MTLRISTLSTLLLATTAALPAAARDLGNGFTFSGEVQLEYLFDENDSATYGEIDVTLGWRSQGGGALTYGFDLTSDSIHLIDDGQTESVQWFSAVLGTSFGEFAIGRPRPLHDTLLDEPATGGADILSLELNFYGESLAASFALFESDADIWGATYKGQSGSLSYGAGVFSFSQGSSSVNLYEVVGTYEIGATKIVAGIETVEGDGEDLTKYLIGAAYTADRWKVGGSYVKGESGVFSYSTSKVYGTYNVTDALSLGVQYQQSDIFGSDATLVGVTGTYGFASGGFAELGYLSIDSGFGSSSDIATASVGFRF